MQPFLCAKRSPGASSGASRAASPGAGTPQFYDALRLVNGSGPYQGRVEVLHQGTWLPVCLSGSSTYFDDVAASVVCGQLGYTTLPTSVVAPNAFGPSALGGEFSLSSYCSSAVGTARLDQCSFQSDPATACISFAAVTCSNSSGAFWRHVEHVHLQPCVLPGLCSWHAAAGMPAAARSHTGVTAHL